MLLLLPCCASRVRPCALCVCLLQHRNTMNEFMGLIRGMYEAKQGGFLPGGWGAAADGSEIVPCDALCVHRVCVVLCCHLQTALVGGGTWAGRTAAITRLNGWQLLLVLRGSIDRLLPTTPTTSTLTPASLILCFALASALLHLLQAVPACTSA